MDNHRGAQRRQNEVRPRKLRDEALDGDPCVNAELLVDARARLGECVLFTQGSSARLTPVTKDAPVDAVIIGIVDTVEVNGAIVEKP